MFQCYFEDENGRCKNKQEDYWCSEEHRDAWQEANYGKVKSKGNKLTIEQIQARLREMGRESKYE